MTFKSCWEYTIFFFNNTCTHKITCMEKKKIPLAWQLLILRVLLFQWKYQIHVHVQNICSFSIFYGKMKKAIYSQSLFCHRLSQSYCCIVPHEWHSSCKAPRNLASIFSPVCMVYSVYFTLAVNHNDIRTGQVSGLTTAFVMALRHLMGRIFNKHFFFMNRL